MVAGLAVLALAGAGGLVLAGGQAPVEPGGSRDTGSSAERMAMRDKMREAPSGVPESRREMMRRPEMRRLMRSPAMRAMHRDMMRMDGGMMHMRHRPPEMGTGMME